MKHAGLMAGALVLTLVFAGCPQEQVGPPPPEPIRPSSPPAGGAGSPRVLGPAHARAGDWVEYEVRSSRRSRHAGGHEARGRVRVWLLERGERGSSLLLQALPQGQQLIVRAPADFPSLSKGKVTLAEDRSVGGKKFSALQHVFDQRPVDGPNTTTTYAQRASELAAAGGVLGRTVALSGFGGYMGSTTIEAVGFGNAAPPKVDPAVRTLPEPQDPIEVLDQVLPRRITPPSPPLEDL